jgi:hypothetical protein
MSILNRYFDETQKNQQQNTKTQNDPAS